MDTGKTRKNDAKKEAIPGINAPSDNDSEFYHEYFIDNFIRTQQEGVLFDALLRLGCIAARKFLAEKYGDLPDSKAIADLINTDHTFYRDITPEEVDDALELYIYNILHA